MYFIDIENSLVDDCSGKIDYWDLLDFGLRFVLRSTLTVEKA
jgi:hypothetical protein